MTHRVRLLAVLVVTAACLGLALWGIDTQKVFEALSAMQLRWIPVAMAAIIAVFFARVLRFQLLLGDARPGFGRQTVVCGIAFLAINVVPLRLGEFVRSFLLLDDDVEWGTSLGAVVMERIVDLFMLLGMLLLVAMAVDLPGTVEVQGIDVLAAGQRAIGVALVVLIGGLGVLGVANEGLLGLLSRIPLLGERVAGFSRTFRTATAQFVSRPAAAVAVLALAVFVWAGTIVSVWALLMAFPEIPARWDVALAVTAFTVAGTVAIPTPGFFGPFEVFCKAVLVLWAVDPAVAATFAVVWHLHQFGFHVVSGVGLMLREGLGVGALVAGGPGA